jgi:peptidoglycan/LPS O-acetylase OafA/YrhL
MNSTADRKIPSLDGLRAISIFLVLIGHLSGTRYFPHLPAFVSYYSNFGVRVFFVISGFLITWLLLQEYAANGTISLKSFYVRRALRILPAAYLYIACVVLFSAAGVGHLSAATLYVSNYDYGRPWLLGHLWSLSVEEQFYMLWPAVLLLFFARRKAIVIAAICAAPILRIAYFVGLGQNFGPDYLGYSFPTCADALASGCLLAIIYGSITRYTERLYRSRWFTLVTVTTILLPFTADYVSFRGYNTLGITAVNLGIALCIHNAIEKRYAILNLRTVVWIGVLSYSLYLWQEPFLNRQSSWLLASFPLNIIAAVTCAIASYYVVERPMLRLRVRLSGSVQLAEAPGAEWS